MIRAILWKEWHEHRTRYALFWLTLNVPVLIICGAVALSHTARTPFLDLNDTTIWRYLPFSLAVSLFLSTIFTAVAGYLAVATFNPEVENHSLFFMFEQPFGRARYAGLKLLNGGFHVVAATAFAMCFAPTVIYAEMLASGRVTLAGSGAVYAAVMAGALRGTIWCALAMLAGFAISAVVATLAPRLWMAAVASLAIITALGVFVQDDFYDFSPPDDGPMSVSVNSVAKWLTISRAVHPKELAGFASWKTFPLLTVALLVVLCSLAVVFLYQRKEFK